VERSVAVGEGCPPRRRRAVVVGRSARRVAAHEPAPSPMCLVLACAAVLGFAAPVTPDGGVVVLGASGLSHTYDGRRFLFDQISFGLARGSKSALIGTNGAGKSSLLRVLGGLESPESGTVELESRVRLAYVEQEPSLPPGSLAEQFLFASSAPAVCALRDYRAAVSAAEAAADGDTAAAASEQLGVASSQMDATDGWVIEEELRTKAGSSNRSRATAIVLDGGRVRFLALC
jgi:ATPase subunit of ABC transporter with duplicated ATPase domains